MTQNTRVQLITPSAQHSVIAHAKTEIYTQTSTQTVTSECQCTTVKDIQQYNTTQNTRVQLTTPSAQHSVIAHAKTDIYTQTSRQTVTSAVNVRQLKTHSNTI